MGEYVAKKLVVAQRDDWRDLAFGRPLLRLKPVKTLPRDDVELGKETVYGWRHRLPEIADVQGNVLDLPAAVTETRDRAALNGLSQVDELSGLVSQVAVDLARECLQLVVALIGRRVQKKWQRTADRRDQNGAQDEGHHIAEAIALLRPHRDELDERQRQKHQRKRHERVHHPFGGHVHRLVSQRTLRHEAAQEKTRWFAAGRDLQGNRLRQQHRGPTVEVDQRRCRRVGHLPIPALDREERRRLNAPLERKQ